MPSIIDNIMRIALEEPDRTFCHLLSADESSKSISYKEMLSESNRYANFLSQKKIPKNQVVIIIFNHGPELIYSFIGSMLYGAIPSIFPFPSAKVSPQYYRNTIVGLLDIYKQCTILTDSFYLNELRNALQGFDVGIWDIKSHRDSTVNYDTKHFSDPDKIVLLQHSSGTTGLRKGVALTNKIIINQIRNYQTALQLSPSDKIVSWLPLYHDMGLIACFILPLVCKIPLSMISPFDWVVNPICLFKAISTYRSTLCWLPNFAYNFLALNIEDEEMSGLNNF